jgi:hypothetical protein
LQSNRHCAREQSLHFHGSNPSIAAAEHGLSYRGSFGRAREIATTRAIDTIGKLTANYAVVGVVDGSGLDNPSLHPSQSVFAFLQGWNAAPEARVSNQSD